MKNHHLLSLSVAVLCCLSVSAATYPSQYDIVYHRISITVNPGSSGAINNGSVTTYFKTTAANVAQIGFDFKSNMTVNSVYYHGSTVSYTFSSNVITISFPSAIAAQGTLDSVTINYSGIPSAPATSIPSGYNYDASNKVIYTLGEAYSGSTWWPCKDSLGDKIDSVDLIVTTPSTYRAAGNGVVTETISGSNRICTWKTRYGIATYMINFAAGDYTNYQYTINTGGVNLPVMNYLLSSHNTSTYQSNVDVIQNVLPVYVSLLNTDYPFLNEKYGIADCYTSLNGNWGALEVQSMTFTAAFDDYTLAHELAHQWFGDKLTTNDWHQIWLNEGFAQYFQSVIYPENFKSASTAANQRLSLKSRVTNNTKNSTTYVNDISSVDKIFFDGTNTLSQPYNKGAMILSMLRAWLGDTKFFTALHNYLNAPGLAYNFTSVDSLKKYMQAQVQSKGFDLTNFFNDWVYKKGYATYNIKYQYVTNGVYIQLSQSPTSSGQGYFDMPVPLRIKNSSGLDTTIVVIDRRGVLYNSATGGTYGTNVIYYKLSGTPTNAPTLDPNNVVLATAGSITSSSSLNSMITLPFQSINLSAVADKQKVKLNWKIETDEILQSVILEKSLNGTDFMQLSSSSPVQVLTNVYQGTAMDDLMNDVQYYRLKIMKQDGSYVYSTVQRVAGSLAEDQLRISPNPAKHDVIISLPPAFSTGQVRLLISDVSGQVVKEKVVQGMTTIKIAAGALTPGVYNIRLVNQHHDQVNGRFIKQ
ncbi:MAG TPA: M1 family aminopeptidase [Chitinophagaceae bacterium]|jgi:hypothetical protein|nr:M1 family aminopeptidase [Chitinophagaceae bacterium]